VNGKECGSGSHVHKQKRKSNTSVGANEQRKLTTTKRSAKKDSGKTLDRGEGWTRTKREGKKRG